MRPSLRERIRRDVAAANRFLFDRDYPRELERQAAEAARPKLNTTYYSPGISPLGGVAKSEKEPRK
jgi:hypothetical protein